MTQSEFPIQNIKTRIYEIRGKQVMLDRDLAELYGVITGRLNEQVKRNKERFPHDFTFQLNDTEFKNLENLISQNATSNWGGVRKYPYAFTEQGVAMLSSVLKSKQAVEVNIQIMRAFVEMRHYLTKNAEVFEKFHRIDQKLLIHDENFNKLFKALEQNQLTPKQGIFFQGQVFDAHVFISDLIRNAEKTIILFDNYVDEQVLTVLSKKKADVEICIYSKNINNKLRQDVEKFNVQYKNLTIKKFDDCHDRFLIIDNQIYHIGASLKDLGKKWFAFSKLEIDINRIFGELE
ncbi:MAG: ORF6N domain-containing protein [Bacteroidetes bacterium]|nr:ORF6N domain-containing protein [Bacteroidota bacterium]